MEPAEDTSPSLPKGISVLVPVYRSAETLPDLVAQLQPVLERTGKSFEVVLVNDGSPDRSWEVITELAASRPWLRGICLMRNYGQHNALLCGLRSACFDTVVTLDDDLQHPPEHIPLLLAKLEEGFDVVYGTPEEGRHGFVRDLLSVATKGALSIAMGVPEARHISAFRALRTKLRAAFAAFDAPNLLLDVLLSWGTTRFGTVTVEHRERARGKSGYTFMRLLNQAVLVLVGFSTAPLRLASFLGGIAVIFGIGVQAYVLLRYVATGGSVPGFPFLASIVSIFAGVQLFVLGIMGEYLARIFHRTNNKPPYAIGDTTRSS
ncbi:MAG: glycosyltransferase family 2 protein [Verrucomicrobiaceae bacterium]|nr:glycosyltransferase family 2 protein [Verrucomicrobiaceae bacterium]